MDFTKEDLDNYIIGLTNKPISSMVENQIKKLCQEGYSYREIARCLQYFYEILGNDIESVDTYGIGIVRSVRKDANLNYQNSINKQEKQRIAAQQVKDNPPQVVHFTPPRRNFHRKEIDINGIK